MQHFPPPSPAAPAGDLSTARDLAPGERLLCGAMLGWADLRAEGERPQRRITSLLAHKTSGRIAALFAAWIQAAEASAARPLRFRCPGCGGLGNDAQRLLVACGLASVAPGLARALLEPLMIESPSIVSLGRAVAAAMAAEGWPLPARLGETAPGRPDEPLTCRGTVH